VEAEAVEAVKFSWERKYFEERSWKRKRSRKHLTFGGAGSGSIFHENGASVSSNLATIFGKKYNKKDS